MANLIKTTTLVAPEKQIMVADELTFSIGAVIGNTGVDADANGKKIIKAGTPLYGDIEDRDTAFVLETTSGTSNANCIALHDVDVTSGSANGTIVLFGFVDLNKLTSATQSLITSAVKTALDGRITFLKS